MAWTEQCRMAFEVSCEGLLAKQKRKNLTKAFAILSKESGIPQNTLRSWWYEKQKEKEEFEKQLLRIQQLEQGIETPEETTPDPALPALSGPGLECVNCPGKSVYIKTDTGKALGPGSKYFGLCGTCRANKQADIKHSRKRCEVCNGDGWIYLRKKEGKP